MSRCKIKSMDMVPDPWADPLASWVEEIGLLHQNVPGAPAALLHVDHDGLTVVSAMVKGHSGEHNILHALFSEKQK